MLAFLNILYPRPSKLAIGVCSVHTIDAMVNVSPVNECSSINMLAKSNNNDMKYVQCVVSKTTKRSTQNYDAYYTKLKCILCLTTSELRIVALHKITLHYTTYAPFLISTVYILHYT